MEELDANFYVLFEENLAKSENMVSYSDSLKDALFSSQANDSTYTSDAAKINNAKKCIPKKA